MKTIPTDVPLRLIPAVNGGWMVGIDTGPGLIGETFAFSSYSDMLRALVAAGNADRQEMPGVPLDEMPTSLGGHLEAAPREPGRFLLDLHLEPGDIVVAVTDDFPMGVHRGSTYRVKDNPFRGRIIEFPMAVADHNYRGARFEVSRRHPKSEAL